MAVFVLNGLVGVVSKIHQSSVLPHADSTGFVMATGIIIIVTTLAFILIRYKRIPKLSISQLGCATGYGTVNGVANLFLLISLTHLPVSVQYPLVTGGVMLFSTVFSKLRREKITFREYLATGIAFVASVLMAF